MENVPIQLHLLPGRGSGCIVTGNLAKTGRRENKCCICFPFYLSLDFLNQQFLATSITLNYTATAL
jgi:hypothetical protein